MTLQTNPDRPVPSADLDSHAYWAAAKAHQLQLPWCERCNKVTFPQLSDRCPRCRSQEIVMKDVAGKGRVHTFTIMRYRFVRGYAPPYVIAQVELDAAPGVRITCNIVDADIDAVSIGMPVTVTFEDRNDGVSLPQFRPQ